MISYLMINKYKDTLYSNLKIKIFYFYLLKNNIISKSVIYIILYSHMYVTVIALLVIIYNEFV